MKKNNQKKADKSSDKDIYKDGPKRRRLKPIIKDRYRTDYNNVDDMDDNINSELY